MAIGGGLFNKVANAANKGVDLMGKANDKWADIQDKATKKDTGQHTMYESFSGGWVTFAITDDSLVVGKEEYPYSSLDEIQLTVPPTKLRVGAARTSVDGKELMLQYALGQAERFAAAVKYANEQIAKAHGITKGYLHLLQSPNGSRVEVYDGYLQIYELGDGVMASIIEGGATGVIREFTKITAEIVSDEQGRKALSVLPRDASEGGWRHVIPLLQQDVAVAQEVVNVVNGAIATIPEEERVVLAPWQPVTGIQRTFTLRGETLEVRPKFDALNSYRNAFCGYAAICSDVARRSYDGRVRDLASFIGFFPNIYGDNLSALTKKSVEVLLSNGVFTVTEEDFMGRHVEAFHLTLDVIAALFEAADSAAKANMERVQGITNLVPHLVGGGFGLKGAAKGIAKAELFNVVRDSTENAMLEHANKLSVAQQRELYGRIDPTALFDVVYLDYLNVYQTLLSVLAENGKAVAHVAEGQEKQAGSIFQNLTNPSFPKEQLTKAFLQVLANDPYKPEYHQFMIETFGDNSETAAIGQYFGY